VQFLVAAPTVASYVNRVTAVPNLSRLIIYTFGVGLACSAQMLVINWRYERSRAERVVRRILVLSGAVVVLMCLLFWLGSGVPDRAQEFPAVFAREPYLAAFLVIYHCAYGAGIVNAMYHSWRGASETPGDKIWLRRAIRLTTVGMSFGAAYAVLTLVAVVTAWFGKDLGYLSVTVAPVIVMFGVPEFLVAITVATWGPRLHSVRPWMSDQHAKLRDYITLGPLWRTLRQVDPGMVHSPRLLSERLSIEFRLFWRVVEINDWLEQLRRFDDPEVAAAAARRARDLGLPAEQVPGLVEAAQIKTALRARERDQEDGGAHGAEEHNPAPENKFAFVAERARLVSVAKAFDLCQSSVGRGTQLATPEKRTQDG
jgi:hypothetical protein